MSKRLVAILGAALLLFTLAVVTAAQVQTTVVTKTAVQNPDGTYTIVEYPVGKETVGPAPLSGYGGRSESRRPHRGGRHGERLRNRRAAGRRVGRGRPRGAAPSV